MTQRDAFCLHFRRALSEISGSENTVTLQPLLSVNMSSALLLHVTGEQSGGEKQARCDAILLLLYIITLDLLLLCAIKASTVYQNIKQRKTLRITNEPESPRVLCILIVGP